MFFRNYKKKMFIILGNPPLEYVFLMKKVRLLLLGEIADLKNEMKHNIYPPPLLLDCILLQKYTTLVVKGQLIHS